MDLATKQIWTADDIRDVKRRISRWTDDAEGPIRFAREAIGMEPTPQQCELLAKLGGWNIEDGKIGITVASGQGVGKTGAASMSLLWFLVCFEGALVNCTAPTETQISTVLWGECERQIRRSRFLSMVLDWKATRILVRGESPSWCALAHTTRQVEAVQGKHRDHMLVVCDEASGIEDRFLDALIGGMTDVTGHNIALWISNPTLGYGRFYDSHHKARDLWHCLRFSARDSPLVSPQHIARMEAQYGRNSPVVQIRVDGLFPSLSESSLVSREWLDAFQERPPFENEPDEIWHLGVDVARYGSAMTAVVARHGRNIKYCDMWQGANLIESADKICGILQRFRDIKQVKIDSIGVGAGLVDILFDRVSRRLIPRDVDIVAINVSVPSDMPDEYPRLRDQLWFEMADRLRAGDVAIDLVDDDEYVKRETLNHICSEILPIEYDFTANGQRRVDSKDIMKEKLGKSPDLSDALLLSFREEFAGFVGWVKLHG